MLSLGVGVVLGVAGASCDAVLGLGSLEYARDGGGDAAGDVGRDTGGASDAERDVGGDTATDAGNDAGSDTGTDEGSDATSDARGDGASDATLDSRVDTGGGDVTPPGDAGMDAPCVPVDCCPTIECGNCNDGCGGTTFCDPCTGAQVCDFTTNLCCTPQCDASGYCGDDMCNRRCPPAPPAPTSGCRADTECACSGLVVCSNAGCTTSCLASGHGQCQDSTSCCFGLSCSDAGFCQ